MSFASNFYYTISVVHILTLKNVPPTCGTPADLHSVTEFMSLRAHYPCTTEIIYVDFKGLSFIDVL